MNGFPLTVFVFVVASAICVKGITCGDSNTQLTFCFPGDRSAAQCQYAVTNSTLQAANLQSCPQGLLFEDACTILPGLLTIAYGPCQQVQSSIFLGSSPTASAGPLLPILEWLEILGIQTIEEVGAILVRGYAFQLGALPSTFGLDIVPDLQKIGKIIPVTLDNARLYPFTVLGAAVPQLQLVTTLEDGLLIENVPNINFTGNFVNLEYIGGPVVIVGNAQLTSLDGLQGLSLEAALNNLEITGNPRLVDISALDAVVNCSDPTMAMDSLGVIEVFPANRQQPSSCFLTSVGQVCEYIATSMCPSTIANGPPPAPPRSFPPLPQLPLDLPLP